MKAQWNRFYSENDRLACFVLLKIDIKVRLIFKKSIWRCWRAIKIAFIEPRNENKEEPRKGTIILGPTFPTYVFANLKTIAEKWSQDFRWLTDSLLTLEFRPTKQLRPFKWILYQEQKGRVNPKNLQIHTSRCRRSQHTRAETPSRTYIGISPE